METNYTELLQDLQAEKIDTWVDGNWYTMNLYKIELWDNEEAAIFYEAIDPSKEEKIVLRVHPTEVKTCMEAKLWSRKYLWDMYKRDKDVEFIKET